MYHLISKFSYIAMITFPRFGLRTVLLGHICIYFLCKRIRSFSLLRVMKYLRRIYFIKRFIYFLF